EIEDVHWRGVVDDELQRRPRGWVENRSFGLASRALAHALDSRPRLVRLRALAHLPFELRAFRDRLSIRGIVFGRSAVFEDRVVEIAFVLERLGAVEMDTRRADLRTLERDLVFRPVGVLLYGAREIDDGAVEVAGAHGRLTSRERATRRAGRDEDG